MKSVYIASPLGFSEVGRDFLYGKLIPLVVSLGFHVSDPFKLTPDEVLSPILAMPPGKDKIQKLKEVNHIMGKNNELAIRKADLVFAILDGADVDSGTASEIGFASGLKKPILGYRGDFRLSSENEGSIVNLQVEYFIKLNGGKIITKFEDLEAELRSMFSH